MTKINYRQICSKVLKALPLKQREVILRRFGLGAEIGKNQKETLESIGQDLGITRERVRQIERDGFLRLKPEIKKEQKTFNYFKDFLKKRGDLRKEKSLLFELAGERFQSEKDKSSSLSSPSRATAKGEEESLLSSPSLREGSMNEVYFLLVLGDGFTRFRETDDFHSFWSIDQKTWIFAQKLINSVCEKFKKVGRPLKLEELNDLNALKPEILTSYLEISKKIQRNAEGFFGLKDWPEINPKRIKDKAYLAFKRSQKPLHFTQVADLIDLASRASAKGREENLFSSTLPQTVHNELIKDQRFVLIGRGIYALKEWGYEEGVVKDVIFNILKAAHRPLKKEEILEKTLKQRLVKKNTIFLNLSNKKYFLRNSDGYYTIKEV